MPFVLIDRGHYLLSAGTLKRIEGACKAAWVSMAGTKSGKDKGPYQETDVGGCAVGLALKKGLGTPHMIFMYNDRGEEFREEMARALARELSPLVGGGISFRLASTNPDEWFADPVWSQAQCQRPHPKGLPPSGYDDGYGW